METESTPLAVNVSKDLAVPPERVFDARPVDGKALLVPRPG